MSTSWKKRFFHVTSLFCLSVYCIDPLEATVNVTSPANAGAGTLRDAIDSVNGGSTPPISLNAGINPIVTSTMDVSTASATITSADYPTVHTITGGGNAVLNVGTIGGLGTTNAIVGVTSNITFVTADLLISGGTLQLGNPLGGIDDIRLSGANPVLQFTLGTTGTLTSTIELAGTVTNSITVDAGVSVTASGTISGAALVKQGAGTLVLPNANLYTNTDLQSGTLHVQNNTSLGGGSISFSSSATLIVDPGLTLSNAVLLVGNGTIQVSGLSTMSGDFSGSGALTVVGGGTLTLSGANTYSGFTVIEAGTTLALQGSGVIGDSSSVLVDGTFDISNATTAVSIKNLYGSNAAAKVVLGSQSLSIAQSTTNVFAGVISGSGSLSLTASSSAVLTLSNVNTYTGSTQVNGGTLALSGTGSIATSSSVSITGTLDISGTSGTTVQTVSGGGTIALGAQALTINQLAAGTFSGVIKDGGIIAGVAGSLVLGGSGTNTLTLSGVNTYTGSTTISAGTLALSGSGSLSSSSSVTVNGTFSISGVTSSASINTLSGSGSINLGSKTLTINQLASGAFSGVISGSSGSLVLSNTSTNTLTLTGINTYTGSTTVGGATLAIAGNGSIASSSFVALTGNLDISGVNSGTTIQTLSGSGNINLGLRALTIVQKQDQSYTGVISGSSGQLILSGTHKLTLTNTNTYTGGTFIEGGTLALSGSGSIASSSSVEVNGILDIIQSTGSVTIHTLSGSGYVMLGANTLTVSQDAAGSFVGQILGTTGGLIKNGTGTLYLSNWNSYEGTTVINAGTLQGGAASFPSAIVNNATLIFNEIIDEVFPYTISGAGVLLKIGTANLILTGNSSFSGPTTVLEGVLTVDGSLASSFITIDSSAKLRGIGSVGGINNLGTINPGHSSGVLHANGTVTFANGSAYESSVDENGASKLIASGNVTIGSDVTFRVEALPGFFLMAQDPKVVIAAPNITGTFSAVTTDTVWLTGSLVYSPTTVELLLQLLAFSDLSLEGNSRQVALAIDRVIESGNTAIDGVVESVLLLKNIEEIDQALNQMQPALFKGLVIAQESNAMSVQNTIDLRMQKELAVLHCYSVSSKEKKSCRTSRQTVRLWGAGIGDHLQQDSTTYAASPQVGYQNNMGGFVIGLDGHFAKCCYLGGVGGYSNSHLTWEQAQGKGNIHSGYAGIYFSVLGDIAYANVSAIGGWSSYQAYRTIVYPGVNEIARNTHGGGQFLGHIDLGVNIHFNGFTLRPFDSANYIGNTEKGFREIGAGEFNLDVEKSRANLFRNELGLQGVGCLCWRSTRWTLTPKCSWVREMRFGNAGYTASFVNTSSPFSVIGYFTDRNLFSPGLTLSANVWQDKLTTTLYYEGEFGSGYSNQRYGMQLQWGF